MRGMVRGDIRKEQDKESARLEEGGRFSSNEAPIIPGFQRLDAERARLGQHLRPGSSRRL